MRRPDPHPTHQETTDSVGGGRLVRAVSGAGVPPRPVMQWSRQLPLAGLHRRYPPRGMSLVELLIAIAIFGIISAITIYDYRIAQREDDLRQAAVKLATHLREIQNQAMTGIAVVGTTVPVGGYGIHVETESFQGNGDPTTYKLFGDRESYQVGSACRPVANGRYDVEYCPSCACLTDNLSDDEPLPLATVAFPRKVKIKKISLPGCPLSDCDDADLSFRPPKPNPYVGTDDLALNPPVYPGSAVPPSAQGKTVTIVLQHTQTLRCRKVTVVGASGQISEERETAAATPGCLGPTL